MEDLQRKSIEYIMSRHSPDERVEPREAIYSHDSVSGPLSGAAGVEDKHDHHEKVTKRKIVREKVVEESRQVDE